MRDFPKPPGHERDLDRPLDAGHSDLESRLIEAERERDEVFDRLLRFEEEREVLNELLARQQRIVQMGLITAALAHDVRNHIQVMSGSTLIAQRSRDPEDWKEALATVQERCCALAETTRAILGFARRPASASGKPIWLSSIVDETVRLSQLLADKAGVRLQHEVRRDLELHGDSRLLVQALLNLTSNAIRACAPSRGTVEIEASVPQRGVCRFVVRDDGPGIPQEIRKHLFQPFVTGNRENGGTGLGLYIVRCTIKKLRGDLRVNSSPEGTVFRIDVPQERIP